jgi:hypothetical protein
MSFHQQNIKAFTEVIQTQRSLFSERDWVTLDKIAASMPEDEEKISEIIATWYEKRPKILDAQLDVLNTLLNEELHARRSIAWEIAKAEAEVDRDYRQELIDAIQHRGKVR